MSAVLAVHGPFSSEEQFEIFKAMKESEEPDVQVERATDAEGRIFARVVSRSTTSAALPSVNPDFSSMPPVASLDAPEPLPTGPLGRLVSARRTGPAAVTYIDSEGRDGLREGGSRAWRNNNPGNIKKGDFTVSAGSIGDYGTFAIFPDLETGMAAITTLLTGKSYRDLTLEGAIFRYAPPSENQSQVYLKFVEKESGVARSEVMRGLSGNQLLKIAEAIKTMEGWKAGAERVNAPNPLSTSGSLEFSSGISSAAAASGEWMAIALAEAALPEKERSEWPDPGENPRILNYFRVAASWFETGNGDETDWCAAFVNFCLLNSGFTGTNHPGARSFFWNKNGHFVALPGPVKG